MSHSTTLQAPHYGKSGLEQITKCREAAYTAPQVTATTEGTSTRNETHASPRAVCSEG